MRTCVTTLTGIQLPPVYGPRPHSPCLPPIGARSRNEFQKTSGVLEKSRGNQTGRLAERVTYRSLSCSAHIESSPIAAACGRATRDIGLPSVAR